MCLSVFKHSCCEYLIIKVVSSGKISNKWGHLLQPVAFGSGALKTGERTIFACVIASVRQRLSKQTLRILSSTDSFGS